VEPASWSGFSPVWSGLPVGPGPVWSGLGRPASWSCFARNPRRVAGPPPPPPQGKESARSPGKKNGFLSA
jgi:hypothetical protein